MYVVLSSCVWIDRQTYNRSLRVFSRQYSAQNALKFNQQKTRAVLAGSILKDPWSQLSLNGVIIDRVLTVFHVAWCMNDQVDTARQRYLV